MLLGGVAVAFVVGVRFDNVCVGQVLRDEFLHPGGRDDVRAVLLAGVQFHTDAAANVCRHLLVGVDQALRVELAGEVDDGFVACPLFIGHVLVPVHAGSGRRLCHGCCSHGK